MTDQEKLLAIRVIRDALQVLVPPQAGKAQHRCELCRDIKRPHPICPAGEAMRALFDAETWIPPESRGGKKYDQLACNHLLLAGNGTCVRCGMGTEEKGGPA